MPGADNISQTALMPAALAADTVEGLYVAHGQPRPWIWWLLLLGCAGALAALPLVQVDVSVQATGVVRPATERVELKAPLGGRIARALARDNDSVAAGQALLELATPDLDERLSRNKAQQAERQAVLAALRNLTAEPAGVEALSVAALEEERGHLRLQLEANRLAAAKARVELDRASALAAKGR